jgi:cell wall assembly regulator SMI1
VPPAPLLTEEMLEALVARWREQGAAIADDLRPGLAEAEMRAATEPFGLTLPAEARVWWGWHDGTASMTGTSALGLDLLYLPLSTALAVYQTQLRIAAQVAEGADSLAAGDVWPRSWLPLSTKGAGMMMVCDCGVPEGAPTPIRHVDHEFFDRSRTPVANSLGTVVTWWIDALDRGAWTYNRERRSWEELPERLANRGLASTGLV